MNPQILRPFSSAIKSESPSPRKDTEITELINKSLIFGCLPARVIYTFVFSTSSSFPCSFSVIPWPQLLDISKFMAALEELDVGSVKKVPRVHGAVAPGEPRVAALNCLGASTPSTSRRTEPNKTCFRIIKDQNYGNTRQSRGGPVLNRVLPLASIQPDQN